MSSTWLVTGSNRGVGFAIVELLLKDTTNSVVATTRRTGAESLRRLAREVNTENKAPRLYIVQLDVQKSGEAQEVADRLTPLLPGGIDYFISNAGVNWQPQTPFDDLDLDLFLEEIKFYTTDLILVVKAFLPMILKSREKKIIFLTSLISSLELSKNWPTLSYPYCIGKAAMNMLVIKRGDTLAPQGVVMALVHPGWVKTEMGDSVKDIVKEAAPDVPQIMPEESAVGVVKVSRELKSPSTVAFYNYDGQSIPW